ncbi:hypothetical protein OHS70_21010 [Streptomyces sp. NBC_00390]|uniref:hypothetical protein n=1 Tax=Streptomyces sp. NBC_00390 TaxID=2975736 RepID=UPI002E21984C
MTTLLIYDGAIADDAPARRTGGVPLVPDGFSWPLCRTCKGAMQFLAHLPGEEQVVSVFMCQNDPGLCEEWSPADGGNRAYLFPHGGLAPAAVPPEGETSLGAVSALRTESVEEQDYFDAVQAWVAAGHEDESPVLGALGGEPYWIQDDETPNCPSCSHRMDFAALLEEGRDHNTAANFGGGGCGYAFTCAPCSEAAFLWQC